MALRLFLRKTPRRALLQQLAACCAFATVVQAQTTMNPIGTVARVFNRKLVQVEDRVQWLQGRIEHLPAFVERPLQDQIGWRCGKQDAKGGPPSVTLDLHRDVLLGEIYLVPAQKQAGASEDLFPRRFTIEAARADDFSDARVVYATGAAAEERPRGYPIRLNGDGVPARYVRVKFDEGVRSGLQNVCALSEIFVFSDNEPVSLGASVTAQDSVEIPGVWEPRFLVDGRTPLGPWEGGRWSASRGDCLDVPEDSQRAEWQISLDREAAIDRVVLFPYELPELSGPGVIPPRLKIEAATQADFSDAVELGSSGDREMAVDMTAPVVIPISAPAHGRFIRVVSERAWQLGPRYMQAMGEIEVWSGGKNLAAGRVVNVVSAGLEHPSMELTDNSSSGMQILPLQNWLSLLVDRSVIEREMNTLRPVGATMAAESELNTTWGAAIALGLTFLIPVAIVERRRLVSKSQLEQLRKRIASDLHDDIGSNLGSISLIARSAKRDLERMQGSEVVAQDLGEVEVIARESSLAMRDIVWLLERRQDTIGDFVQRMRDTAARLLRDTEYSVVSASSKGTAKLTLDAKRHLFLFYKEALHNILKHSQATQVLVRLHDSRDRLVLEIQDNGIGLPRDAEGKPRGVAKLTDRARVLEGILDIESAPNQGTTLRLSVKRGNLVASKLSADE